MNCGKFLTALPLETLYTSTWWAASNANIAANKTKVIGKKEKFMDWSSLASAIIGGICTLLGGLLVYYRQSGAQTRQAASVLYYDLKSIESYLKTERSSVNIRYFSEWQSIVAEWTFLEADDVEQLYKIYDLVYDYDYHYRLKEERGAVAKDDISQYIELKRIMFYSSDYGLDLEKYNSKYKKLLETLKDNQKKVL